MNTSENDFESRVSVEKRIELRMEAIKGHLESCRHYTTLLSGLILIVGGAIQLFPQDSLPKIPMAICLGFFAASLLVFAVSIVTGPDVLFELSNTGEYGQEFNIFILCHRWGFLLFLLGVLTLTGIGSYLLFMK